MTTIRRHLVLNRSLMLVTILVLGAYIIKEKIPQGPQSFFDTPIEIHITLKYVFDPKDGIYTKAYTDIELTAYSNKLSQTDSTPNTTASGRMVAEGILAISQDYWNKEISPGDLVYVKKIKKWLIADDCKNIRFSHSFDIFMFDNTKAIKFGKQKSDVYVWRMLNKKGGNNK